MNTMNQGLLKHCLLYRHAVLEVLSTLGLVGNKLYCRLWRNASIFQLIGSGFICFYSFFPAELCSRWMTMCPCTGIVVIYM